MQLRHRLPVVLSILAVSLPVFGLTSGASAAPNHDGRSTLRSTGASDCSAGSHTLSSPGDDLYPDAGNGGYVSVHTDVRLVYDATSNQFLSGTEVQLHDRATQCLSSFSLDMARTSNDPTDSPDLTVGSITVDGRPATFEFVQPTYPGDPNGQDDPNHAAHEASQHDPVGGPDDNPLPPACSPELTSATGRTEDSQDGDQCPANKLMITPRHPIRDGARFTVTVEYIGQPGIYVDGDGETEGWFRSSTGGFVTTEPIGSEAWMPLNNFPTAKPTYDFYDTVNAGLMGVANGVLESTVTNAPDSEFPGGSVTYHWHERSPVANYLVEDSVGAFDLSVRKASDGVTYYAVQDATIPAAQQQKNLVDIDRQQTATDFEAGFNGPYPFASDGVLVGTPVASFQEEMETMITFEGGKVGTRTLYHENMHQWWGDNVTESNYNMTFYKEGLATMAEFLDGARVAETRAGGPSTPAGQAAFNRVLIDWFDTLYSEKGGFWEVAPSNPTPFTLFDVSNTYNRPAAAYLALRQILGPDNFDRALQQMQQRYGGGNIDEAQLEAGFAQFLPDQSASCTARLGTFFTEWFDTAYPAGGGINEPQLTGPGLDGPGFYDADGGCS